jgi:hypothetical protein
VCNVAGRHYGTSAEESELALLPLRGRQGTADAVHDEIARAEAAIKSVQAQKQRAIGCLRWGDTEEADVERESARINELLAQANSGRNQRQQRRALSAQVEPLAERVREYCHLVRQRLGQLDFQQKREPSEALQAQLTLELDGSLTSSVVVSPYLGRALA